MKTRRPSSQAGFTLFEVLLAASMTMIVMFGALYTTTENFEVVREGDRRTQSNVAVRRAMDRLLKDCRYANWLQVQGEPNEEWTIALQTAGEPEPSQLAWTWNSEESCLKLTDGESEERVVENLNNFKLTYLLGEGDVISQISLHWSVGVSSGFEATPNPTGLDFELAGSTWIRKNVPSF